MSISTDKKLDNMESSRGVRNLSKRCLNTRVAFINRNICSMDNVDAIFME